MSALRLTIWKRFRSDRAVSYASAPDTDEMLSFDVNKLHEMIYSWSPDEDVLSGIVDESVRVTLRMRLFEDFSEGLPPESRSFEKFGELIDLLGKLQSNPEACHWTTTGQPADSVNWQYDIRNAGGESSITLRCVPTITLYQHFLWLADVFGKMPGLSITIR